MNQFHKLSLSAALVVAMGVQATSFAGTGTVLAKAIVQGGQAFSEILAKAGMKLSTESQEAVLASLRTAVRHIDPASLNNQEALVKALVSQNDSQLNKILAKDSLEASDLAYVISRTAKIAEDMGERRGALVISRQCSVNPELAKAGISSLAAPVESKTAAMLVKIQASGFRLNDELLAVGAKAYHGYKDINRTTVASISETEKKALLYTLKYDLGKARETDARSRLAWALKDFSGNSATDTKGYMTLFPARDADAMDDSGMVAFATMIETANKAFPADEAARVSHLNKQFDELAAQDPAKAAAVRELRQNKCFGIVR